MKKKSYLPSQDEQGRREILAVHCRSINLGRSEDEVRAVIEYVATLTPGSSGAELAALVNEATIRAVRRSRSAGMPAKSTGITTFGEPFFFMYCSSFSGLKQSVSSSTSTKSGRAPQ